MDLPFASRHGTSRFAFDIKRERALIISNDTTGDTIYVRMLIFNRATVRSFIMQLLPQRIDVTSRHGSSKIKIYIIEILIALLRNIIYLVFDYISFISYIATWNKWFILTGIRVTAHVKRIPIKRLRISSLPRLRRTNTFLSRCLLFDTACF